MRKVMQKAPECKVSRQVELVQPLNPGWGFATLRIRVGRDEAVYTVQPTRSDIGGRAAHFVKQGPVDPCEDGSGHHDVLLDGADSYCDCKGFLRWGHCRHLYALEVALRRKWL